jgi:hypothetical protein
VRWNVESSRVLLESLQRIYPHLVLVDIWKQIGLPAKILPPTGLRLQVHPNREDLVVGVIQVQGKAQLFEIIQALRPRSSLAHLLHRREKESGQQPQDSNHNQDFDKGDPFSRRHPDHFKLLSETATMPPVQQGRAVLPYAG